MKQKIKRGDGGHGGCQSRIEVIVNMQKRERGLGWVGIKSLSCLLKMLVKQKSSTTGTEALVGTSFSIEHVVIQRSLIKGIGSAVGVNLVYGR